MAGVSVGPAVSAARSTVIVLKTGELLAVARPPEAVIASRIAAGETGTGWWCPIDGRVVPLADVQRVVPASFLDVPEEGS